MTDERELDDELLADDFAHFLTRGMAGESTLRHAHGQTWELTRLPVPAARCSESWADEQGCASVDNIHRCGRDAGRHRCHSCISCDAMVVEDTP